jgi:hypothetical protein
MITVDHIIWLCILYLNDILSSTMFVILVIFRSAKGNWSEPRHIGRQGKFNNDVSDLNELFD